MIKRNTWILLVVLVILVAGYLIWKHRPAGTEATETPTPTTAEETSFLFSNQDGTPTSIRVDDEGGNSVQLERDSVGVWTLVLPRRGPADLALASAAETQVMSMAIVTALEASPEGSVIGLASPAYVITVTFDSGARHTIEVGE